MKYQFIFLLLSIPCYILSMNFDEFDRLIGILHHQNFNTDTKINSIKENAELLLQLSRQKISKKKINHLAQALENLYFKYPVTRSIQVNNGIWPCINMILSVPDRNKSNQSFNHIISVIEKYKGFPTTAYDMIEKSQKACLSVVFPKEIPLYKPFDELRTDLTLNKHMFYLYPVHGTTPEKHLLFKKIIEDNVYLFRFIQQNSNPYFKRELFIQYSYKNDNKGKRIKAEIEEEGDFDALPKIDQEKFAIWDQTLP